MNNPFEVIGNKLDRIEALLAEIKQTPSIQTPESAPDEVLTVPEAAKFLSLKQQTIYSLIRRKLLPAMKRSKQYYFFRADLVEYLKQGKQITTREANAAAEAILKAKRG